MTWSIIVRETTTGRVGIAVATCFFAVGARVPHIEAGVGALASQALTNPLYAIEGLALLRAGVSASSVVERLTGADPGREHRQLHIMDRTGRFAAFTGDACIGWCGHRVFETFSIAGNMLVGPAVLEETAVAYESNAALPLARRLLAAMQAGESAGGDKRGKQSAALLIDDERPYSLLDIRVDDHADPLAELIRLEAVARQRWVHMRRYLPTNENPAGLTDRALLEAAIARSIAEGWS